MISSISSTPIRSLQLAARPEAQRPELNRPVRTVETESRREVALDLKQQIHHQRRREGIADSIPNLTPPVDATTADFGRVTAAAALPSSRPDFIDRPQSVDPRRETLIKEKVLASRLAEIARDTLSTGVNVDVSTAVNAGVSADVALLTPSRPDTSRREEIAGDSQNLVHGRRREIINDANKSGPVLDAAPSPAQGRAFVDLIA